MSAVATPADQAADYLQKLSLDSQSKTVEVTESTKKPSVDSSNLASGIQSDRSITPQLPDSVDPSMYYLPSGQYYYGFDPNSNDWEGQPRYVNPEGVEVNPGAYGDNGSYMYHPGYTYAPYTPYSPAVSPGPTMGHDAQMYGAQHYQYPTTYVQSMTPTGGPYTTPSAPTKGEIASSAAADQAPLSVSSTNFKSYGIANSRGAKGNNGTVPARQTHHNSYNANGYGTGSLPGGYPAASYQDPRYAGYDGLQWPTPWLENPYFSDGHQRPVTSSSIANRNSLPSKNQNFRPHPMSSYQPRPTSGVNTSGGYINKMYPNKLYGQYDHSYRSGMGYGSGYDARTYGRGWMSVDSKYKPRGRGNGFFSYGSEGVDGLNELNRGPRAKPIKNQKGFTPVSLAVKGQTIPLTDTIPDEKEKSSATPDLEQYNLATFPETYSDAKFFIIKSYSEDDVHKSIKYNVWSSTSNGNKKLDTAYMDAQQKSEGCPVFLFFSVNTSGQFVGVAEMIGPVDFDKSVEYWQQDKWIGCFPVKWHIVKDTPNTLLKHIIIESNESKPVTNSRDTQEVKLDQGLQMLQIFKDHTNKQCILDDFDFYEDRQKKIQEKKAKQHQYQKQAQQVRISKPSDEKNMYCMESANAALSLQKPLEAVSGMDKEAASAGENRTMENSTLPINDVANGVGSC